MQVLKLKTVRDLEEALELGQVPADEVRETVQRWLLAVPAGELNWEEGVQEAAQRLLTLATR